MQEEGSLTIAELIEDSRQTTEDKGFHNLSRSFAEEIALFHSEISEALEEFRNGRGFDEIYYSNNGSKPEGIPVEIADVLIRIFDSCKTRGIPIEEALRIKSRYNKSRPPLHGGKRL